jgi:CMP-N,N'-diacetyllegionaminic acid synthase
VIEGASVLALITARGGSKGLDFSVAAARAARCVDRVVLSTDDEAIAEAGRRAGCEVPFRRPAVLASDTAASIDVVLHALDQLPAHDIVVLLQPTSPARSAADIDATLARLVRAGAPACVSVTDAAQSPYWMYRLDPHARLEPLLPAASPATRRQDLPPVYVLNGAVYAARTPWLRASRSFVTAETVAHVMPPERSIDIDTLDDFETFERLVARGLT